MRTLLLSFLVFAAATLFSEESVFHFSKLSLRNLEVLQHDYPEFYSQTLEEMNFYRTHFERSAPLLNEVKEEPLIPRTLHFIWLGEKKLPDERILHSWKKYNPNYTILLWTDRPRNLEASYIEQRDIQELLPLRMEKEYRAANNWGEKSDILRYEILERVGGIYADIDIECIRTFDDLTSNARFFASSTDVAPVAGHNIHVINSIIGSVAQHPIIKKTIERVQGVWETAVKEVRGLGYCDFHPERTYAILLCLARTYIPFTESILEIGLEERDFIFPVHYFNYSGDLETKPVYTINHSFQSWFPETSHATAHSKDEKTKKLLSKCCKLSYKFIALSALVCFMSVLLVICVIVQRKLPCIRV